MRMAFALVNAVWSTRGVLRGCWPDCDDAAEGIQIGPGAGRTALAARARHGRHGGNPVVGWHGRTGVSNCHAGVGWSMGRSVVAGLRTR